MLLSFGIKRILSSSSKKRYKKVINLSLVSTLRLRTRKNGKQRNKNSESNKEPNIMINLKNTKQNLKMKKLKRKSKRKSQVSEKKKMNHRRISKKIERITENKRIQLKRNNQIDNKNKEAVMITKNKVEMISMIKSTKANEDSKLKLTIENRRNKKLRISLSQEKMRDRM